MSKSSEDCASWLQRVHSAQIQSMTPEARGQLHIRVEQSRRAERSRRSVCAVKSHSMRSTALLSEGLRQMSVVAAPAECAVVQARWREAQMASEARQTSALAAVASMDAARNSAGAVAVWNEQEEEAQGMRECAALVGVSNSNALLRQVSGHSDMNDDTPSSVDFESLLRQLVIEPSDDDEMAAKFALYETYSETVSKMRTSLFMVHKENQPSLPEKVAKDMAQQLKKLDKTESMGVPDGTREWFVYHMMRQAGANNQTMAEVLDSFEKKLEFLAKSEQAECPICLDSFSDESPAETLSCCHRVCRTCWAHWTSVMHGHPFCPLCRNDEFIHALSQRAGAL